jgi:hypothetical protein
MTMMTKRIAMALALAAVTDLALAQEGQPRGKAEATINGKKVVIEYGRPALKGRTLDALMKDLPEDRIWRAGDAQHRRQTRPRGQVQRLRPRSRSG